MSNRERRTIVVTGASGFIGSAVARRLLRDGHQVRGIGRSATPLTFYPAAASGQMKWHRGDLVAPHGLTTAFAGADFVIHAAALVDSAASDAAIIAANVTATRHVCEMALAAGVERLVHIGTSDVFGLPVVGETITERAPYRDWNEAYPDTKIAACQLVHTFRARGLASTIIHPGWTYGPGDGAFFPKLLDQVRLGFMPDWSPPTARINLVYIDDLVDALCSALVPAPSGAAEFLILDPASGVSLADICRSIARRAGRHLVVMPMRYGMIRILAQAAQWAARAGIVKVPLLTTTDAKSFGHDFRFSVEHARYQLGWVPTTPTAIGLAAAIDALLPATLR